MKQIVINMYLHFLLNSYDYAISIFILMNEDIQKQI